ncbi:MAG: fumarylacetoacetase [Bacteroidota bacterium]
MIYSINETHDPGLQSWVESANQPGVEFPIQNLPFGVFKQKGTTNLPQIGTAIGDQILALDKCAEKGWFDDLGLAAIESCDHLNMNGLMALDYHQWSALRSEISKLLRINSPVYAKRKLDLQKCLVPMTEAVMLVPAEIGDYTDFYASIYHATNIGSMFRPDNPLLPNYKYVPIGYHGRASSIVVSGVPVRRPNGQIKDDTMPEPIFGPSKNLDYELELGCYIGKGNAQGSNIPIAVAENYLFGISIVNDWSARDIQRWEYQPLGPFLAKNFATTISPWIITMEALAPFRVPAFNRPPGDPKPLSYLNSAGDTESGGINVTLDVFLSSKNMRTQTISPVKLSSGKYSDMYWTLAQMAAHHASNGCNFKPGDLIASGTISGSTKQSRGCLMELTWRGSEPLTLPTSEQRTFLEDGDEVIMNAYCERDGFRRIGLGECRGIIIP